VARGREIYEHGIASEGVPACSSCHGPDAHGLKEFPRLAGQHAQYILKQLASFQSNMRNVAIMHGVAQNLLLPEMQAVAAYLEAQP
jgi:cytochrome c553